MTETPVEGRIEALDLGLFDSIQSQSGDEDKRGWLTLQRALRHANKAYCYLEIGSHLGGSIQQHLVDPRCAVIYSIDKRPATQPDIQGVTFRYDGNSTERMLDALRRVDSQSIGKVVCFEASTEELEPASIEVPPDLCFIDGEHTVDAVVRDFEFCARVARADSVICFHDVSIIYPALNEILRRLRAREGRYRALKLPGDTFAIVIGSPPAAMDPSFLDGTRDGSRFLLHRRLGQAARDVLPKGLLPVARSIGKRLLR